MINNEHSRVHHPKYKHSQSLALLGGKGKAKMKMNFLKASLMHGVLLMTGAMVANAENISFQDANVKTICVYYWDTNGDGELSYEEALQVTRLGSAFERQQITSFDELQYFNALESIDSWAVAECAALESITLPTDIKNIDFCAFYGCTGLKEINIPSAVTTIGKAAFKYCSALEKIVLPNSVETLEDNAFQYCTGIRQFNLGNVQKIGARAVAGCTSLQILYMPNSVTAVGEYAFEKSGIRLIDISPNLPGISPYMLAEMTALTTINLQYNCSAIGEHAFEGCTALKSITLPPYITSIGSKAFNRCPLLKWVYTTFTQSLPTLAENAFMLNSDGKYVPTLYAVQGYVDLFTATAVWNNFYRYREYFEFNFAKSYTSFSVNWDADFSENSDLKVFTVAGCSDNKQIILEELKDKYVPAYTGENNDNFHGVLLFGEAGKDYTCKIGKKAHNDSNTEIFSKENLLVGCTNETYIEPETDNALNYVLCDNAFKAFKNAGFIKDGKAYLSLPKTVVMEKGINAKETLYLDGETTDIFVVHEKDDNGNDRYYTINGQEISSPFDNGVYIHKGKKYLKE